MVLPILLAQDAPRDLTPENALSRQMVYKPGEMLATSGLGSLGKHLLPPGDVEVRYWGGFAWGTHILIFRHARGKWSAAQMEVWSRKPPSTLPAPKLGWPAFWTKAEKLGIFTLPDQEQAGSKKASIRSSTATPPSSSTKGTACTAPTLTTTRTAEPPGHRQSRWRR